MKAEIGERKKRIYHMKIIPKFKTEIKDGTLIITPVIKDWIISLNNSDVEVSIKKWHETRSNYQNNYYWGVVLNILSDELGYSLYEMHDVLKSLFLKQYIVITTKKGEKEIPVIKSTTTLSTKDFEDYLTLVREWSSSELGIYVPLPNETM